MDFIIWAFLVSVGINIVMFLPAFRFRTDKLTDISYAVTFAVVALAAYSRSAMTTEQLLLLGAVSYFGRLGWADSCSYA
jgi:hypothetical protein